MKIITLNKVGILAIVFSSFGLQASNVRGFVAKDQLVTEYAQFVKDVEKEKSVKLVGYSYEANALVFSNTKEICLAVGEVQYEDGKMKWFAPKSVLFVETESMSVLGGPSDVIDCLSRK